MMKDSISNTNFTRVYKVSFNGHFTTQDCITRFMFVVPICYTHTQRQNRTEQKTFNSDGVQGMNLKVSQPEDRSCSGVWWYDSGYLHTSCQMAAGWLGWLLSFSILQALRRHLSDITNSR